MGREFNSQSILIGNDLLDDTSLIMKIKRKTTFSQIASILQDYESKKNPTQMDLILLTEEAFDKVILKWQNLFDEIPNPTYEDAEDVSDFIIDLCDMLLVFVIRKHSLDTTDAPYEVPREKLLKLKKHFTRILISKGKRGGLNNELISLSFLVAYLTPIRKSDEHRKLVLAEKTNLKRRRGGVSK